MSVFTPLKLIEEVKKRPGLYNAEQQADREVKLGLWKEVGASIFPDWDQCSKATAYDRVLQLQRKWRSLRDAYNRELRARKTGIRINKRPYVYFKKMSFLGGHDGDISEEDESTLKQDTTNETTFDQTSYDDPLIYPNPKVQKSRKRRNRKPSSECEPEEIEMPVFNVEVPGSETDSDKLFLLSFLPEMKQLPMHIKMWARAQIANIMQEAFGCHYNNTMPGASEKVDVLDIKRQRRDSSDE